MPPCRLPAALGLVLLALPVHMAAAGPIESAADVFVTQDGFAVQDVASLDGALAALVAGNQSAIAAPGAAISAIEKAFLAVDSQDGRLFASRYRLRYDEQVIGAARIALIVLERYNIEPILDAEESAGLDADSGPPAPPFSTGPHVAWRLALALGTGADARLLAASRREISDMDAAGRTCAALACLSTAMLVDETVWAASDRRTLPVAAVAYPAIVPSPIEASFPVREIVPAYQARELGLFAGLAARTDTGGIDWSFSRRADGTSDSLPLDIVSENNLGQDIFFNAVLGSNGHWVRIMGGLWDESDEVGEEYFTADGPLAP